MSRYRWRPYEPTKGEWIFAVVLLVIGVGAFLALAIRNIISIIVGAL